MKYLLQTAEKFADRAAASESMAELTGRVDAVARDLGFRYWALVHHLSLRRSSPRLIESSNYPGNWAETIHRGQFVDDPVLHASQRTLLAFPWTNVARLLPAMTRHQRGILESSRNEGIGEGLTVPAHLPGEPNGSCSFATRAGVAMPARGRMMVAQLIGQHAFERARHFHGYPHVAQAVPHLSPREQDCIRLLVRGASDKAIARQLGLSPETARRYIKTARAAYGATTRTELIVRALADGLVSFAEAVAIRG